MHYIKRTLEGKILTYKQHFPIVGITGPRQAGKSTMLQHLLTASYRYISFDRDDMRTLFYADPNAFMANYANRVIFDEVQKVPEIFEYLKIAVDNDRNNYGKYIITGSAQFSLLQQITESLAGRIGLLTLLPLQFSEIPTTEKDQALFFGSYPETVLNHYAANYDWYSSYISTYLERDVRGLYNIGDLRDFRRLLSLLAAHTSQILNFSRFANDLGVAVSTVKRWISVLEASYIIFLLPPFYKNYGKRVVKSPKLYFYDTGLVAHLTGIHNEELFKLGPMAGPIFENYVISEIIKQETHRKTPAEFYYYRTAKGEEVDLIVDTKTSKNIIEIKFSATFKTNMLKEVEKILDVNDRGYLLYNGETLPFKDNIKIYNYKEFLTNDHN